MWSERFTNHFFHRKLNRRKTHRFRNQTTAKMKVAKMIFHNFLQQIHSVFSSKKAELELTGKAEQEYDRIMKELKKMTPEERRMVFQNMKLEPVRFTKEIDGTTYIVRTVFQSEGNETLLDHAESFVVRNL